MITQADSERLNLLRLPLIVGVIFIHAFSLPAPTSGAYPTDPNTLVQLLLSEGFARLAVPIFFLMAGYFLHGPGAWSGAAYSDKLKTRARSLLVPMLLWGCITLGIFAAAQALPTTARYFSGSTVIANFGALDYANALFGFSSSPIAYQFWFIRELILLVVASPLLLLAVRVAPWVAVPAMVAAWLLVPKPYPIPAPEAVLFFSVGLLCRARDLSLFALDSDAKLLAAPYLLLVATTPLYLGDQFGLAVQKVGIALGVPVALWLTGFGSPTGRFRAFLLRFAPASFFIFAGHEPLLTIAKKLLPAIVKAPLAVYLLAPVGVFCALLVLHAALSKALPRLTGLLSGGR